MEGGTPKKVGGKGKIEKRKLYETAAHNVQRKKGGFDDLRGQDRGGDGNEAWGPAGEGEKPNFRGKKNGSKGDLTRKKSGICGGK